MGQRCLSTSSCVLEEIFLPSENELGFWKPQAMHYYQGDSPHSQLSPVDDAKVQTPLSRSVVPSSLEKSLPAGLMSVNCLEMPISPLARDHKEKYHVGGYERNPSFARALEEYNNNNRKASPNLCMKAVSYSVEINKLNDGGTRYRNSLSSSKLSEVFGRKSGLSKNNGLFHKSVDTVASCHEEEELSGSMEEIEVQTIGNLLPDEDDIFSGVLGELEYNADAKGGDDAEDFDLFSSVGGMELESKDVSYVSQKEFDFTGGVPNDRESSKVSLASAHPHAQHPSRTLFARNIHINVEESELRVLFEQFGDIQTLYTACKHQGFIMISYFDIRAAKNAMIALQDKLLGHRKLDIHYSTPKVDPSEKDIRMDTSLVFNTDSSVSNENLHLIFGIYGEIMEIRDTPCKCHRKFIVYYDVRAAEAAHCALNNCNISGEQIKLGPCCPEGERQCLIQKCSEMGQDEAGPYRKSVNVSSSEAVSHGGRTVGCLNNGSVQDIPSVSHVPLNALTKNALRNGNFGVLDSICSQSSLAPSSNHFGFEKPRHFLDQVKFDNKCIPSFFPRSFPECQDTGNIFIPQNSSSAAANMVSNIGSGVSDGMTGRNITVVDSSGKLVELKGGVSSPSPNVTSPFRGPLWSNSNSFPHHLPSPMTWQKSPLFGVSPPCPPQLSAFSEMLPDMLNTGSAPNYLHAGSAPITSPSLWDRRHAYTVESPEGSVFCLGSLGSNIPANSPLHAVGRPSHTFSRAGGNCMEKLTNDALHSPHQTCHIHPARNTVTSLPTSFGSPHDCRRNLSHRRNQSSSNYGERKQFELDIDRILQGDDSRTTLMIKNIPNKYTSKLLLTTIDEHCEGTYDFIYLPIDFKNKCNVGYAFINLIDPLQIIPFYKVFSGKKWEKFNSEKVAALAYARIQGKAALVAHFQNSSLMNEDKRCRPILICTDGPNAGEQEPFPVGTNIRSKSGRARSSVNEDHHHHHHHQGSSIYVN